MTLESLKEKINVLEIIRQRVPGCGTGVQYIKTRRIT